MRTQQITPTSLSLSLCLVPQYSNQSPVSEEDERERAMRCLVHGPSHSQRLTRSHRLHHHNQHHHLILLHVTSGRMWFCQPQWSIVSVFSALLCGCVCAWMCVWVRACVRVCRRRSVKSHCTRKNSDRKVRASVWRVLFLGCFCVYLYRCLVCICVCVCVVSVSCLCVCVFVPVQPIWVL